MDSYEEQMENMRRALSRAWSEGWTRGWADRAAEVLSPNPYFGKKEN